MNNTIFLGILLLAALSFAGLSITIDAEQQVILPGTAASFTIRFTNTGDTPIRTIYPICTINWNYYIDIKAFQHYPELPRPVGSRPVLSVDDINELKPKETAECYVAPNIFISPGEYSYRIIYDPMRAINNMPDIAKDLFVARIESEWITFKVSPLSGEDKEIFSKYYREELSTAWLEGEDSSTRKEVLAKYPSSSYAGMLLMGGIPIDTRSMEQRLGTLLKYLKEKANYGDLNKELGRFAIDRIHQLQKYLCARPDFIYADWMHLDIAYRYLEAQKFELAYSESKTILHSFKGKHSAKIAQDIIDVLSQKGLVKKD